MKASYDRDADILTIEVSSDSLDHAEEAGSIIIHVSPTGRPVPLEILDASEFLANATRLTMSARAGETVDMPL